MPTGKHRNTAKRSSGGGSYASTVTTVVFVCIFILGVWMLTSNSYVSLNKATTRISQGSASQARSRKIPIDSPAFEDNPGDLPEDAIRPDDGPATRNDMSTVSNETKLENEKTDENEQEKTEMEVEKKTHIEKNKVEEVQISEESIMTQDQKTERAPNAENISENEGRRRKSDHQKKKTGEWDMENNEEHHISQEKQQREEKGNKNDKRGMQNNEERHISQEIQQREEKEKKNDKWGMMNNKEHHIPQEIQQREEKGNKNDKRGMENNDEHHISHEIQQREEKEKKTDKRGMKNNEEHHISQEIQHREEKEKKTDKRGMKNNEEHHISQEIRQREEKEKKTDKWGITNIEEHHISQEIQQREEKEKKTDKWGITNIEEHHMSQEIQQREEKEKKTDKWGMKNNEEHHISQEIQQREEKEKKTDKWGIMNNEEHHISQEIQQREEKGNKVDKQGMENNEEHHISQEIQQREEKGNKVDKWGMENNEEHHISQEKQKEEIGKKNDKWGMENNEEHHISQEKQKEEIGKKNNKWGMENNEEQRISEEEEEKGKINDMQTNMTGGNDKRGMVNNEEQNITEEEQEMRIEKHEEQQEESQNEEPSTYQKQQNKEKAIESPPPNEKNPPKEEGDVGGTTTTMVDQGSSGIPKESIESKKGWKTQAGESDDEKERQTVDYKWELCNVTSGTDYVPCLDNAKAIEKLRSRKHFEHRERHCPEEGPMCLVPVPEGYMTPIPWPQSRDKIWFHNVPHKSLANIKGHQNWVKVTGEFLTFPGGGTQFIHGALHYIDLLQQAVPEIEWGKRTRVVLDVGCGVASFGGYLFDRNVLAMSLAPNDEHESQIQFALERGIPAISAVMGSQRLPFPSNAFDLVHCARCRVPWHREGGMLLLEINRLLRPGGYFVWSATPVYRKTAEDAKIWAEMSALTVAMCWELVTIEKDKLDETDVAIYRKPESNECFNGRKQQKPPMCKPDDDPNAAWYVPLQACMHNIPTGDIERGSKWPEEWPARVQAPPYWLNNSQKGIYGNPAPDDFKSDYEHWKRVVSKSYMTDLGFNWTNVRNVMDMRAVYGGFAAALKDLNVWVLNVVNINSPDTLPIIYERGLFGIYHDWCESFSTYPRTYDLLHADHLFSMLKNRCKIAPVIVEVDRIVRPGGKLIVRDESSTIVEVEKLLKSLHWDVNLISKNQGMLTAQKSTWRPDTYAMAS